MHSSLQLSRIALTKHFVWLTDLWRVLAEWRSASMEYGEQSVVITMIVIWPELCADNMVSTREEVSSAYLHVWGHVGGYTNN